MTHSEYLHKELTDAIDAYYESELHLAMLDKCHQSPDIVEERAETNRRLHSLSMAIDLTKQLLLNANNSERGVA